MTDLGESFRDIKEYQRNIREIKYTKFKNKTVVRLEKSDKVISITENIDKFIINTTNFGIIDVYPKANRLLIRNSNKWFSSATQWLINNLIN